MADLNARTDSFITLLLDVSGRARPGDMADLPADEALALLDAFRAAHPERSLVMTDGALTEGVAVAPAPAPEPVPEVAPPAAPDWMAEPVSVPAAPEPYPGVETQVAPTVDEFGIPTFQPLSVQDDPYAVAVDPAGVPTFETAPAPSMDPYETPGAFEPMGVPVEQYGVPAAVAPEAVPNPELPSWVYEQPATPESAPEVLPSEFPPAPTQPVEFAPVAPLPVDASYGSSADVPGAAVEPPAATPPEPDFEAQLLQDIDEDLTDIPRADAGTRKPLVSPVILIALGVALLAVIAVGVLWYLGILFPEPEALEIMTPSPASVATSASAGATGSAPATKAP